MPKTKWMLVNDRDKTVSTRGGKISWTHDRKEADLWAQGCGPDYRVVDAERFAKNPTFNEVRKVHKPRYKDWQPGESRMKIEVVTPKGTKLTWYIPKASESSCRAMCGLANNIATALPMEDAPIAMSTVRAIKRFDKQQG